MPLAPNVWCAARPRNGRCLRVAALGWVLLLLPGVAAAQEGNVPRADSVAAPRPPAPPWRNHASAFVGVTNDDGQYGFTLGLDYERRFHQWYGAGGIVATVFGEDRELVVGPTFFLHPVAELRLGLTAGAELRESEWDFLFRIGLDYEFEWKPRWTIAPSLALDFARGRRIVVVGASVGHIF